MRIARDAFPQPPKVFLVPAIVLRQPEPQYSQQSNSWLDLATFLANVFTIGLGVKAVLPKSCKRRSSGKRRPKN
jgi:hypothetical protein